MGNICTWCGCTMRRQQPGYFIIRGEVVFPGNLDNEKAKVWVCGNPNCRGPNI